MKNDDIFSTFFRKKPALMLINLKNVGNKGNYASCLAKEVDCTYSHVVKILQQMQKANLVEMKKNGRLKVITLTDAGNQVAEHIAKTRYLLQKK